jgi:diguanylate cyclase (GGDEF)-like protein
VLDGRGKVQGMQGVLIDITQRRLMEQQIKFLAYHDALTGLPNRNLFFELARNSLLRAKRDASLRAVFFIDLDGFKQVNDTAGHNIGDQVLAQTAQRLRQGMRGSDILCRLGGDEFAVLLEIADKSEAVMVAERIIGLVSQPIIMADDCFVVGCSIGISLFPDHGQDTDDLLKSADKAMYQAKADKENAWLVYRPDLGDAAGAE